MKLLGVCGLLLVYGVAGFAAFSVAACMLFWCCNACASFTTSLLLLQLWLWVVRMQLVLHLVAFGFSFNFQLPFMVLSH